MIPDFETLMRPILETCEHGEVAISDVVEILSDQFELTQQERDELLPSGKQTRMTNRVHWARSYLKQAGLVKNTKRGHFIITDIGSEALKSNELIRKKYLEQFSAYQDFRARTNKDNQIIENSSNDNNENTPDEILRKSFQQINDALIIELLDRLRETSPAFFERTIVDLLLAMGYGATSASGAVLGKSGDNGVDGVINQDALGVDQVYVQAKRYAEGNNVGASDIRDFFGALALKDVVRGIFVTTSSFSPSAKTTAEKLNARIVLIDGVKLARLMISYNIGCRIEETYRVASVDDNYFE